MHYLNCMLPSKNLPAKTWPRKRLAPCQESNEARVVFLSKIRVGFKIDPPLLKIYPSFLASLKIDPFFAYSSTELVTIVHQRPPSSPTCFSLFVYSSLLLSGVDPFSLLKIDNSFFFLCPSTILILISITPHRIYLYSPTCLIFGWIEIGSNLFLFS